MGCSFGASLDLLDMRKFAVLISGMLLLSCNTDDEKYFAINHPIQLQVPANFPSLDYQFINNPLTEKGFELGRKLFYDGRLSSDGIVSCAFCHEQQHAFTHHGHDLSHGVRDLIGTRNTPALQNLAFQTEYFFDGASNNLEMVALVPIHNPVEMNETLPGIIEKLQGDRDYQRLFAAAFENKAVNSTNMLKALAQYMTLLISADSRYDQYVRNENGVSFTAKEKQGLAVFRAKCTTCHASDLFTDHSFRNNGLPVNQRLNDLGREEVTGHPSDRYKFKVPSLRNIALTAPYMHDGRFGSLEAVLAFYEEGVQDGETLDPVLRQNGRLGIRLNPEEKEALLAFLKTLTDESFIQNSKYYYQT